jgi:Transport protein Avl9
MVKILPFLALPDGAHLNQEDYSYFHLVPSNQTNPQTVFGISCNRQISSSQLLVKSDDVTRSTVQKAVVILASKPVFGPIRYESVIQGYWVLTTFVEINLVLSLVHSSINSISPRRIFSSISIIHSKRV